MNYFLKLATTSPRLISGESLLTLLIVVSNFWKNKPHAEKLEKKKDVVNVEKQSSISLSTGFNHTCAFSSSWWLEWPFPSLRWAQEVWKFLVTLLFFYLSPSDCVVEKTPRHLTGQRTLWPATKTGCILIWFSYFLLSQQKKKKHSHLSSSDRWFPLK